MDFFDATRPSNLKSKNKKSILIINKYNIKKIYIYQGIKVKDKTKDKKRENEYYYTSISYCFLSGYKPFAKPLSMFFFFFLIFNLIYF